jgi:putative regulator of septum formation
MAAPAGVSSGSASEPATPEPAATEPMALEPSALEPSALEPLTLESLTLEAVVPEPPGPAPGESTIASLDGDDEPAADEHAGERRGVSRLVVAGVIVVLIAVAVAAGVLVVATHGFRPKTIVTYRPAPAVFGLRAGECLNSSPNGLSFTILPCTTPHGAEVFATFSLTGSSWPGSAVVKQQANSGCANRIAGYVNPQLLTAGLNQQFVYPDQDAWQAGVRTVVCEVSSATGPLTGSVRNSG